MYAKGSEAIAAITRSSRGSVIERMPDGAVTVSAVNMAVVMGSFLPCSSKARAGPEQDVDGQCGERPSESVDREQDQVELVRVRPVHLELFEETGHERGLA